MSKAHQNAVKDMDTLLDDTVDPEALQVHIYATFSSANVSLAGRRAEVQSAAIARPAVSARHLRLRASFGAQQQTA